MNHIIFDMDGVILDSETLCLKAWQTVSPKYNIDDIYPTYLQIVGCNHKWTIDVFKKEYGEDFPVDDFIEDGRRVFKELSQEAGIPTKQGIRELLEYLKENDYKIALASSTGKRIVEEELESVGLLHYFDVLVCGDMVTMSKPNPEIFLKACAALGGTPSETIVIEDSYNGIRAAFDGGFYGVMVPDILPANEEMEQKAKFILPSLSEVLDYIKNDKFKV